ncbi:MAG: M23 family metallopeptidase [Bdellovibrionales bacterium]|jgi:murein DD-endopeptidase MepM/ murein hydrolase activator NlpD|nr:M23 family metallopeptidase [Bdellovibrionales bacterium]MBT3525749.1 M23 family metallopeptidase [Bdellovibrionales bacterium]MBT7670138.1 M23 family metallopeptidase [Bdellovibrionales bacterium]MBT7766995.1 M23 family metallopeptidase [Bdellovibrionales bacterium]
MKITILFSILIFSFAISAAEYVSLTLKNSTTIEGEFIDRYEDRWFYEEDTELVDKYILIFRYLNGRPDFSFQHIKDIKNIRKLYTDESIYKDYLRSNNLVLKNPLVKNQVVLTGNEGHHKFERMYGNFAWDIGITDASGRQYVHSGMKLDDYYIFDREVVSPIDGRVVGKVSDQLDNLPSPDFYGDLSDKKSNYLIIQVDKQLYLSIVHFKKDSISVNVGDFITSGQELGKVGNSGVSYIPHLHYTMYIYIPSYNRFISVPGVWK